MANITTNVSASPLRESWKKFVAALVRGCVNLGRHIENVKSFGLPVVVAINHFVSDTDAEVAALQAYAAEQGVESTA